MGFLLTKGTRKGKRYKRMDELNAFAFHASHMSNDEKKPVNVCSSPLQTGGFL